MTKDNRCPLGPRVYAPFLARLATAALCATLLLPPTASALAGTPAHPHVLAHPHHHAAYSAVAASVSPARHAAKRSSGAQPAAKVVASSVCRRGRHCTAKSQPAHLAHLTRSERRAERRAERKQPGLTANRQSPGQAPKPLPKAAQDSNPQPAPSQAPAQFAQDQQVAAYAPVRQETLRGRIARFFFGPMRGSHESLVRQNQRAQQDGLKRVQDADDISRQVVAHTLVALPSTPGLRIDETLPADRRYTRPWTSHFLIDLAAAHAPLFHSDVQVDSAVRTVQFQKQLIHVNGNAAPWDGDTASSHLMGGTVDLAKRGMSSQEIQWMRAYLWPLQQAGKVDVEEEFKQACFHIAVYKSYLPQVPQRLYAENARPHLHPAPQSSPAEN